MTIEVPEAREIQRSLKLSEVIHTPNGAFSKLESQWPHGRTAEIDDEKEHLWTPPMAFNQADHIIFLVRVPSHKVDSAKVEEKFLQSDRCLKFRRDARGIIAEFKTRQEAFDFLTSSVLAQNFWGWKRRGTGRKPSEPCKLDGFSLRPEPKA